MDFPEDHPPPTAIHNHHDEHLKSKACATKTNNSNNPNENIELVTKATSSNINLLFQLCILRLNQLSYLTYRQPNHRKVLHHHQLYFPPYNLF